MQSDPTLSRRQLLGLAAGAAAGAVGASVGLRPARAAQPPKLTGTPFPLVALDGKAPLGQVYDHPPNYETPTTRLIGKRNAPYTDAEDYYVRYREADVYRADPDAFRLRVGGEAATEQLDLSLDDLRALPAERVGTVGSLLRPRARPRAPDGPGHAMDERRRVVRRVDRGPSLRGAPRRRGTPRRECRGLPGRQDDRRGQARLLAALGARVDPRPEPAARLRAQRRAAPVVERLPAAGRRAGDVRAGLGQAGRRDRHPTHPAPQGLAWQEAVDAEAQDDVADHRPAGRHAGSCGLERRSARRGLGPRPGRPRACR